MIAPGFLTAPVSVPVIKGGDFFSTEYKHCHVDCELKEIAEEQGRFIVSKKSRIFHSHPMHGSCKTDDVYKKAYSKENLMKDQNTYYKRKRERMENKYGVKLAICLPLTDQWVYSNFFFSFVKIF